MALVTAYLHWTITTLYPYRGDFDQVWHASRAVLRGVDPYSVVGPGLEYSISFPLYYPMPAFIAAVPLAVLPLPLARFMFVAGSAGILAWALTRYGPGGLWILTSGAFLAAVGASQWSPLMTAALLLPVLAPITLSKPNLALAFAATGPGRPYLEALALGGILLVAGSFAVAPGWLRSWLTAIEGAPHLTAPVLLPGGVAVLGALVRWRRAEARLLLAMACVPHTTLAYETLPLLLVPRGWKQRLLLVTLSLAHFALQFRLDTRLPRGTPGFMDAFAAWTTSVGTLGIALIYLPCTVMVLLRPNRWCSLVADSSNGGSEIPGRQPPA